MAPTLPTSAEDGRTQDQRAPTTYANPLLATKLYVPRLRPTLVARPQLLARLDAALAGPLTIVSAPAGFGKTTLLSAWRASPAGSRAPVAWVSLDANDGDPTRFWTYVLTALESFQSGIATTLLALQAMPPPPIEVVLTDVLNRLAALPEDVVLVLDDYHVIETPAIHQALAFMLDHVPPHLHLVIVTRVDPPLPLARLRVRGQLVELRAAELRFTPGEASTFLCELMGLPLGSAEIAALEVRTEGWVAGLQLAALAMRTRTDHAAFIAAFSGSNRFIVDYLVAEVLERLPLEQQTFLLQSSILDRLCGPLCAAMGAMAAETETGELAEADVAPPQVASAQAQRLLEELERTNLFLIPLDDQRGWYRYHHLFSEVLRGRLQVRVPPARVMELHRRASQWLEQHGLINEAIDHALLGQAFEHAAELIETLAFARTPLGQFTYAGWLSAFPTALRYGRPRLRLAEAYVALNNTDFIAVELMLQQTEALLATVDEVEARALQGEIAALRAVVFGMLEDPRAIAAGQHALALVPPTHLLRGTITTALGYAYYARGQLGTAEKMLVEALPLLPSAHVGLAQRTALLAILAMVRWAQGRLREAQRLAEEAIALGEQHQRLMPAANLLLPLPVLGNVLYEQNDLPGAEHYFRRCIEDGQQRGVLTMHCLGLVYLVQVLQARNDVLGALALVLQAETTAQSLQLSPNVLHAINVLRVLMWIKQGNLLAAHAWAATQRTSAGAEQPPVSVYDYSRFALARLSMAEERWEEANTILAKLLHEAEISGCGLFVIKTLSLQALLAQAQGDAPKAYLALERALRLAEPEGYVRTFVDEGRPMAELLHATVRALRAETTLQPYIEQLLAAFEPAVAPATSMDGRILQAGGLVEPLSERELEILRLIAAGRSNQAIADTLVIALSTVKKHINNLYGKLVVESRTQALVRARELNLL